MNPRRTLAVPVLLCLFSLTATAQCPFDSTEPNQTCGTATPIFTGATYSGFICPQNDVDWYRFSLSTSQQVTITLIPPQNPCLDYDLQLFSACGTIIGFSALGSCAIDTLNATLAAGTYRVVIVGSGGGFSPTASYALSVATPSGCPSEASEPNQTCGVAAPINPGVTYNRYLCPANDLDWYSFTLGTPQSVSITLVPPQSPCRDYDFQLFGSCGNFLGFSANLGCATETLNAGTLQAGTYRIVVIGSSGAFSATDTYALTVVFPAGCPAEAGEPNPTCSSASPLSIGNTIGGWLCPANDLDWYVFSLSSPQSVVVTLTPPQNPCLDYDLQLFGDCGSFLGFSANGGCASEVLSAGPLVPGSYRLVVIGFNGASSSTAPLFPGRHRDAGMSPWNPASRTRAAPRRPPSASGPPTTAISVPPTTWTGTRSPWGTRRR